MSKYLKFLEIPFKGKTKRFNIISKYSFDECKDCEGRGVIDGTTDEEIICGTCQGTGKTPMILGRISWYPQWRQYTFSPGYPTIWNKECLNDIILFINALMRKRTFSKGLIGKEVFWKTKCNPKCLEKFTREDND